MAKEVMDRRASDNKYLHRDFHGGMNYGINYIGETYGDDGVREYLSDFARTYHAPLIEAVKTDGFAAIENYLKKIYEAEEASDELALKRTTNTLTVHIRSCPAINYLRQKGIKPSRWFVETTRTIWATVAEASVLGFELLAYDDKSGEAEYRFTLR